MTKDEVLKQPKQEPVGEITWAANIPNSILEVNWTAQCPPVGTKLYTFTPQRKPTSDQEHVAHSVVLGALFDFMGWLTSRTEQIVLSSTNDASPAVDAITDFAKMRGLRLSDARVEDWNTSLTKREWVGLTSDEFVTFVRSLEYGTAGLIRAVEAKLKKKNA